MDIKIVDDFFAVAPQIVANDIFALKAQGYDAIICNRPDREQANQPPYADIETQAKLQNIACYHIPIIGADIVKSQIQSFEEVLDNSSKVLAYCRSGTRSIIIWSLVQLSKQCDKQEILNKARSLGYNLNLPDLLR